jgi:hypothetical protein
VLKIANSKGAALESRAPENLQGERENLGKFAIGAGGELCGKTSMNNSGRPTY